jgi:hypothetical protein
VFAVSAVRSNGFSSGGSMAERRRARFAVIVARFWSPMLCGCSI